MFIGREKELKILDEVLQAPSCCVLVYGKRRVGKTTLLLHALSDRSDKTIYYECEPNSMRYNVDKFIECLYDSDVINFRFSIPDFEEIFKFLDRNVNETLNIIIDEYSYLKETSNNPISIDGMFQKIVDNHLSHIRLFLCGSHVGMMTDLLNSTNPLFGRFTRRILLDEWNYKEASACYPEKSPYDKVAFYAVFGGSPYINTALAPDKSLKDNIIQLYLTEDARARLYVDQLFMTSTSQKYTITNILENIGNGHERFSEIMTKAHIDNCVTLTRLLSLAISLGLVKKDAPINKRTEKNKMWYEINDNVVRFYYAFVHRHLFRLEQLGPEMFYMTYIEPKLKEFVSKRFEDICRTYFSLQIKSGKIHDVLGIGTYFYDNPKEKKNGEFDVVLQKKIGYDIYEVKYFEEPMSKSKIEHEENQIRNVEGITVDKYGFISVNGFEDDCKGVLITGADLYDKNLQ